MLKSIINKLIDAYNKRLSNHLFRKSRVAYSIIERNGLLFIAFRGTPVVEITVENVSKKLLAENLSLCKNQIYNYWYEIFRIRHLG